MDATSELEALLTRCSHVPHGHNPCNASSYGVTHSAVIIAPCRDGNRGESVFVTEPARPECHGDIRAQSTGAHGPRGTSCP